MTTWQRSVEGRVCARPRYSALLPTLNKLGGSYVTHVTSYRCANLRHICHVTKMVPESSPFCNQASPLCNTDICTYFDPACSDLYSYLHAVWSFCDLHVWRRSSATCLCYTLSRDFRRRLICRPVYLLNRRLSETHKRNGPFGGEKNFRLWRKTKKFRCFSGRILVFTIPACFALRRLALIFHLRTPTDPVSEFFFAIKRPKTKYSIWHISLS
jgi:hypothetical protein